MICGGSIPLSPPFTHLSPLRRDADAHTTEPYLPCLYPANEGLPRQELGLSYWMERRSQTRLLSKQRCVDIFDGSPGPVLAENKKVVGASSARFSSIFAEQGSDEYAASEEAFEYSNIDPHWRDTLVQRCTHQSTCPLGCVQSVSPKEGSRERRRTLTSSEPNVNSHVRETSPVSRGVQISVPGDISLGVSRPIRARDRFPCPFPGCRKYSRTVFFSRLTALRFKHNRFQKSYPCENPSPFVYLDIHYCRESPLPEVLSTFAHEFAYESSTFCVSSLVLPPGVPLVFKSNPSQPWTQHVPLGGTGISLERNAPMLWVSATARKSGAGAAFGLRCA
jgi:hypothetical protein